MRKTFTQFSGIIAMVSVSTRGDCDWRLTTITKARYPLGNEKIEAGSGSISETLLYLSHSIYTSFLLDTPGIPFEDDAFPFAGDGDKLASEILAIY